MTEALSTIKDKITGKTMVPITLVLGLLGGSGGLGAMSEKTMVLKILNKK